MPIPTYSVLIQANVYLYPTQGYKNVHHKEEYGFTKYFVDDSDKKHYHNDYDNSDAYFKSGKAGGQKGNKYIVSQCLLIL